MATERDFRKLHKYEHQPSEVNIFPFSCKLGYPSMQKLLRFLPFLQWVSNYSLKKDLLADIVSGFTVGVMKVSQGEMIFHLYFYVLSLYNVPYVCEKWITFSG